MGQMRHGTAMTTHVTRAKIQASKASLRELAEQYHINPKTAQKWKNRDFVEDLKCGAKLGQGSVLTEVDEAVIVEIRRKSLLPLDDLLDLLHPLIPALTHSNLHRCLQRHNISRLADLLPPEEKAQRKAFKDYALGYLHIDTAQIHLGKAKWYLFVAIDRTTRYVYVELHDNKRMETAAEFLKQTLAQYLFKVEKILTDNGIEFSYNLLVEAKKPKAGKVHPFVKICQDQHIEHRTTLVKHPWTNDMVETMNKKIKANTVKRFHYDSVEALKAHLYADILNYNYNLKLCATGRRSPFEAILDFYRKTPVIFTIDPNHLTEGLNTFHRLNDEVCRNMRNFQLRTRAIQRAKNNCQSSSVEFKN
jgi:transposase-like protein